MQKYHEEFVAGDFVRFHTQYGHTTGIIEYITLGTKGKWPQRARITVTFSSFRKKTYIRPLYKLKKIHD